MNNLKFGDCISLYKNKNGEESEYLLDQEQFNNICKIKPEWIQKQLIQYLNNNSK